MNDSARTTLSNEVEQHRQQLLQDVATDHGPNWAEQYAPGTFGCHELLDRTFLTAQTVEEYVLQHPACVNNPEWFALAERAVAALNDLYQKVGAGHVTEQSAGAPSA